MKKIGITQRLDYIKEYDEIRNSLDIRWQELLNSINIIPIPLPINLDLALLSDLKISGIILTGGNDLSDLEINKTTELLDSTLGELTLLLDNINNGDGTISKIIQDKDLYDVINKTLDSIKSLMEDIEKNPKKYIKHVL